MKKLFPVIVKINTLKFVAFIVVSFISTQMFAQFVETDQAKLVIEGEVMDVTSKWKDDKTHIITESLIKIKYVFKGSIRDSIISIETFGGEVNGDFHYSPHTIQLSSGYKGYFFLDEHNSFISYSGGFAHIGNELNTKVRHNGAIVSQQSFEEEILKSTRFPKISAAQYFRLYDDKGLRNTDTCNIIASLRDNKSIDFSFKNVTYTGGMQFIEFDVYAKVNTPGLKFGRGVLYINYSEHFGTNAIENETIEVTKGNMIQSAQYMLTSIDYTPKIVKILILPQYTSNGLYTFSTSDVQVVHVKIKIADFSSIGSISFDDIDISGEVYYWCKGAYGLFDETNLSEPIRATSSTPGNAIGIKYTFENVSYSPTTNKLSVDLFAEATAESKFSDAILYISYNELGFGSNIVANNKVFFQQQDLIENDNVYSISRDDHNQNTFSLVISNISYNPDDYNILATTPRKLGKLVFDVVECAEPKNLHFDQLTVSTTQTHYTGNMPFPLELYSPVIADDQETGSICGCQKPVITDFSPHQINGGVGEILTIKGHDFGTFSLGNTTVIFQNGDEQVSGEMEVGANDFVWDNITHWTDTEIRLKVPGCDKGRGTYNPPATGKFKVRNLCDVSDESDTRLEIPFSIINFRGAPHSIAHRINLQPATICFSFSNDVPNWVRSQFIIALNDWCAQTHISFKIGPTITKNTPLGELDGINLVSFKKSENDENNVGAFMLTTESYFLGNNYCFSEIDFTIITNLTNPTYLNEEAMRKSIKHELGHAHMLNHAKGLNQLMHPNGSPLGIISDHDLNGAKLVFDASKVCGGEGIGMGECGGACTTSVQEYDFSRIQISPNPVTDVLTIVSEEESIFHVNIINQIGYIVKTFPVIGGGDHILSIKELPPGYYICHIFTKSGTFNKIFIKL